LNWRPKFEPAVVRRELQIIKEDLHCNAVRICGKDVRRLTMAANAALDQGLEVWLSPEIWDKPPGVTLDYITGAAKAAEDVRRSGQDRVVFMVGSELTLFMQGILEGRSFRARLSNPGMMARVKAGGHNKPLNEFLSRATERVRSVYHGKVSYASLVWEDVDWSLFDFVGVDHYRAAKIEDRYASMLEPSFKHGKPVVITEFGYATTHGGIGDAGLLTSTAGLGPSIINEYSQFFHYRLPLLGRLIKPRLNGDHVRDEEWQAAKLIETLKILDGVGVDGAFVFTFESQITPYDPDPRYDLDMASTSLVRFYEKGERGKTYADMPWEPKGSFRAVAEYYGGS